MTSAIILCGGLGTRLRSAVPDLPKAMAPVAGRPFLEHQLDYWIAQGIDRFVLSVGYRHEAISAHFGPRYRGCPIDYVIESTPLGTGGALLLASAQLATPDPFLLLNGDTWFAVELDALRNFAQQRQADWCFSLHCAPTTTNNANTSNTRYMGIETNAEGRVTQLQSPTSTMINGGVYWVTGDFLQKLPLSADKPSSLESNILPLALQQGLAVFACASSGRFIDIGIPEDYVRAQTMLAELDSTNH